MTKSYTDPTTGEYVGEHETRKGDGTVNRQTEWFPTEYEARQFSRKGDIWSQDPDRTTRNDDTRTSAQVTADVILTRVTDKMPCVWCPEYGWHEPTTH